MAVVAPPPGATIPPPFDWSTRSANPWYTQSGVQKIKEKSAPVLGFELDKFQAECPARILDGQDVFCIHRTGAGKSTLISVPVIVREGTISVVVAPTNFLQRDMVASMQKKNISCVAINSETLTEAALVSPPRDLWAEAKTGVHWIIFIGPETMRKPAYKDFIRNGNVRARLAQFTVDELHVADEWGVEFRVEFQDIPTMRAWLPPHTTFVGLSATIEPGRQFGSCLKLMAFQPGFHLEKQDCERRDITMIVR
ncbi:P-loop containing nucleoside triphosphate hydrolase protein, partial [Mycena belliarum]